MDFDIRQEYAQYKIFKALNGYVITLLHTNEKPMKAKYYVFNTIEDLCNKLKELETKKNIKKRSKK